MATLKQTVSRLLVSIIIISIAAGIILLARGYRLNIRTKTLSSQGILIANASPSNAQIYINSKFYGVTSDNIYLHPGRYEVVLKKEGYNSWKKTFTIKGEVVSRTDAQLFSTNPSLTPLTHSGIINPTLSPSKEKIVYFVKQQESELINEETGGVFISTISSKAFSFTSQKSLLISTNILPQLFDETKTKFVFSPDESNLLVFLSNIETNFQQVLLISTKRTNENYFDVTLSYEQLLEKWRNEETQLQEKLLETFRKKIRTQLKENSYILQTSPDKTKILYFATSSGQLESVLKPPLIGSVPTQENRTLKPGNFYVYDSKEDKNFQINMLSAEQKLTALNRLNSTSKYTNSLTKQNFDKDLFGVVFWYYNSRHIIHIEHNTIYAVEYDDQNKTLVYSGPFEKSFAALTTDGKIIIMTKININTTQLPDLYSVTIR